MNAEQLFAQITRVRFWIVIGAVVLISLHPEWIIRVFRADLTAWDIVLGIVGISVFSVGLYVLVRGFVGRDSLVQAIGLIVVGGGLLLLWLTFG